MIKHIVVFKLDRNVTQDDPRVQRAFAALRSLPERIPEIRGWEIGENLSDRPMAMDYALYSTFETAEDLAQYVDHPAHREVVALLKEVCTWYICDYEA